MFVLRAQQIFLLDFFFTFLDLIWSFVFRGQIGILVTTIWVISDLLSWIFGDFKIPEMFMKFPDFDGKITTKTYRKYSRMKVFVVSKLRKRFPTNLGMFPRSLRTEKRGWKPKIEVLRSGWQRKWARPLKGYLIPRPRLVFFIEKKTNSRKWP